MTTTDYDTARAELRDAELALMLQREAVAELRRELPPGPVVEDYEFAEAGPDGTTTSVRLSELFTAPDRPLVLYHFMIGKQQGPACPMCTMWADGWAGVSGALAERVDFALVAGGPVGELVDHAEGRGWTDLRLLGAGESTFKRDLGGEDEAGHQTPVITVYALTDEGVRLTYDGGAHIEGEHWRGVDLLSPVWHLLDLTPDGRGDWMPSL